MKYYFGYVQRIKGITSTKWTEDNGDVVGGKFTWLERYELTETEYETMSFASCEATWPYNAPS